jgi:ketosteroid isomerase-like protein
MTITEHEVRALFSKLESGDGKNFFDHVADDVDWTVEGTHPLAGHYRSKEEFFSHTFARLNKILPGGTQLKVESILTSGDWAVVELRSMATARNGMRFDNRYCWVVRFENGRIVQARAYLDSALVQKLIDENPIEEHPGSAPA